jgi:hypothetical protein
MHYRAVSDKATSGRSINEHRRAFRIRAFRVDRCPSMKRFLAVAFLVLAAAATTAGCGGSSSQPQRQFVTDLNRICRRSKSPRHVLAEGREVAWRSTRGLAALLSAYRGLPGVAKLAADLASPQAELRASLREHVPFDMYPSEVRIYQDEKALGLSCWAGPPPKPPEG